MVFCAENLYGGFIHINLTLVLILLRFGRKSCRDIGGKV